MNRIPPEIESLLWSVAESGNEDAISEFGERYPQHRAELGVRLAMVRQLKGAKPKESPFTPPRFEAPLPSKPAIAWPRWAWAPASLLIAIVAYASYSITLSNFKPASDEDPVASGVQRIQSVQGSKPSNPVSVRKTVPQDDEDQRILNDKPANYQPPTDKALALRFERISLHAALDAVGQQSGIRIDIAPGLEDFDISMRYNGYSAMEILQDMGKNFGFSVFPQGERSVLIIPEVDKTKQEGGVVQPAVPVLPPDLEGSQPPTSSEGRAPVRTPPQNGG